jgi:hypothetical protein
MSEDEAKLVWQARLARYTLNAVTSTRAERIKALSVWQRLYCAFNAPGAGRALLERYAAENGLAPLSLYLRLLDPELRKAILFGEITKTGEIKKYGKRRRGRPERDFADAIDIAERVEDERISGRAFEAACNKVADDLGCSIQSGGAVRKIYDKHKSRLLSPRLPRPVG